MIYKMELSDSFDTMVFDLLEVPIEDRDVTGIASNTTIDGNVFNDYLWLKKQYVQKWSILCQDEYEQLRGFWTRQFGNAEVPFYRLFYGKNDYEERNALTVDGYIQLENPTERLAPLSLTHLYGNATQETLSGKNLYDFTDTSSVGAHTTASADGKITTTFDNSGGSSTVYDNYFTRPSTLLETSTQYYIVCEIFNVSVSSGDPAFQLVNTQGGVNQFTTGYTKRFSEMNAGDVIVFQSTTRADFSPCNTMLRTFCSFSAGQSGSITYRISVQKEATTASTFVYEPFVGGSPMPNPQFPSPVETVTGAQTVQITGKNMFDGWTIGKRVHPTDGREQTFATAAVSGFIPVDFTRNPSYYLSGLAGDLYKFVAAYNANKEFLGRNGASSYTSIALASYSFVSGTPQATGDIKYLRVSAYETASLPGTIDEVESLQTQLEIGSSPTAYEPYQSQSQEINLGKNLLPISHSSATATVANITATSNDDGTITLDGTGSENGWLEFVYAFKNGTTQQSTPTIRLDALRTYTLSSTILSGTVSGTPLVVIQKDATSATTVSNLGASVSFTGSDGIYRGFVRVSSGQVFNNAKIGIQLELGTQATSYTPFIHTSKNMLNPSNATAGKRLDSSGGLVSDADFSTSDYIEIKPNTAYIFSMAQVGSPYYGNVCQYDENKTFVGDRDYIGPTATSFGFTSRADAKYVRISDRTTIFGTSLMLEQGSTVTGYESYFAQLELAKIGTYQDYIWNDDGTWKIHKEIGKYVFDSTNLSGWGVYGTGTASYFYYYQAIINVLYGQNNSMLSNYESQKVIGTTNTVNGFSIVQGSAGGLLRLRSGTEIPIADWKNKISATPMLVYYALATPTDTEITDSELIEQLNRIYSLYRSTNNLWLIPNAGAQGEMEAKYRLIYEEETDIIPQTPVVLTLSDGGVINPCGCRQNVQLTMRETKESSEI